MSYLDPLNNRVNFKLNAARAHLENLRRLESRAGSLAGSVVRLQAEVEVDEFLYQLIGVKDALLQEINVELRLGLPSKAVTIDAVNRQLGQMHADARDITRDICNMLSNEHNPLWLVNELHNQSKHRCMIGQAIIVVDGALTRPSLIDPRTGQGMQAPIVQYLTMSLEQMEDLQNSVHEQVINTNNK